MNLRVFLIIALLCLLWGANMIISRIVVDEMAIPPIWFVGIRSLVVAVLLFPWLRPIPPQLGKVLLVTFLISGGGMSLMFIGLRDATPSAASVVALSSAPMTVLFAIFILGERIHWRRAIGIALTFAGVIAAIASPEDMEGSYGLLIIFGSAICGALGSVYLKQLKLSPLRLQAWAGAVSAIVLLPLSAVLETGQIGTLQTGGWPLAAAMAYTVLGVSIFAHTTYFHLLQTHDANLIAPLTLMTPLIAIILGATITGDQITAPLIVGGLLTALGVLIILLRPSATYTKPCLTRPRI